MIPLRDVIPSRTTPFVTIGLIAVSALAYVCQLLLGWRADNIALEWALVPAALSWAAVLASLFLHRGLVHAAVNMLYLWIFGANVEDRMGHGRFLAFYLMCGTAAAFTQMFADRASAPPMVGASGAIAGVIGAYFVLYPQSRILTLVPRLSIPLIEVPAVLFLGFWFLIPFLNGLGVGAFWVHLAGLAVGMATVGLFRRQERLRVEWWSDRRS